MRVEIAISAAMLVLAGCSRSFDALAVDGAPSSADARAVELDCSPLVPCGGVLDGAWVLRGQCGLTGNCPGATYDYSQAHQEMLFSGGMVGFSGSGTARITLPLSCLATDAGASACGSLDVVPGYSCQPAASACACTVDVAKLAEHAPLGPYTVAGNQFFLGPIPYSYCIAGTTLRFYADGPFGPGPINDYARK